MKFYFVVSVISIALPLLLPNYILMDTQGFGGFAEECYLTSPKDDTLDLESSINTFAYRDHLDKILKRNIHPNDRITQTQLFQISANIHSDT